MKVEVNTEELKDKAVATTRVVGTWLKRVTPKAVAYVQQAGEDFAKAVAEERAKGKEEK